MKVKLTLRNNLHFSGEILETNDSHITLRDKFGGIVLLLKTEISICEVLS